MKAAGILLVVLLAATVNGSEDCQWGPSYWCQSYDTAVRCGKVSYCDGILKNKNKAAVTASKDTVGSIQCDICEFVVKELESFVNTNTTEEEAKEEVEKVCNYLGGLASECKSLIDEYFGDIWQLIFDELSPAELCGRIGLCTSSNKRKLLLKASSTSLSTRCDSCETAAKYLIKKLNDDSTKDNAEKQLKKFCKTLKSSPNQCEEFVDKHLEELWKEITEQIRSPKALCTKFTSECRGRRSRRSLPIKWLTCPVCKELMKLALDYIKGDNIKTKITDAANKLCTSYLPSKDVSQCEGLVDPVVLILWEYVLNMTSNEISLVCADIGACATSKYDLFMEQHKKPRLITTPPKMSGEGCDLCKMVLTEIKPYVDSTTTQNEVKSMLKTVCGLLGNFSTECNTMVDSYFDFIWSIIKSEVDSGEICTQIGLCNSTRTVSKSIKFQKKVSSSKLKVAQTPCDLCKLVVTFVKPYVDSNSTEAEIKQALDQLCNDVLPDSYKTQCTGIVDQYLPLIWALLKSEVDSGVVCTQLGLCNSTSTVSKSIKFQKKVSPTKLKVAQTPCDICKLVVTFVKPYVDSNSTEQEVKQGLEQLCGLLPGDAKTQCTGLVDSYFDVIWNLVKSEFDNDLICRQLGLCNSTSTVSLSKKSFLLKSKKSVSTKSQGGELCDICKTVVSFLKPFVDSSSSQESVENALDKFCGLLPSANIKASCTSFVNQYFPVIWDLLVKHEIDGDQICNQLKLCTPTNTVKSIMSQKKVSPTKLKVGQNLCDICELVVTFVKPYVDSNSTEQEVKQGLEQLCNLLPSNYKTTCTGLIDSYFDVIWSLVKSEFDNDLICKQLGLCNSTKVSTLKSVVGGAECAECELVITYLYNYLKSNGSKDEIKSVLNKVCSLLGTASSECNEIINTYFPMVWPEILQLLSNSKQVCGLFKLCTTSKKMLQTTQVKSSPTCYLCKLVLNKLESYIINNSTEQDIEKALDKVCSLLPKEFGSECQAFVNKYGAEIIQLIIKGEGNGIICTLIGLCAGTTKSNVLATTSTECIACEGVLTGIKEFFVLDPNAFDIVCKVFPSPVNGECVTLIKDYGPALIKIITNEINPEKICKEIKLCN